MVLWSPSESNISLVGADCPCCVAFFFAVLVCVVIVHLPLLGAALELVVGPLRADVAVCGGAAIAGDGHSGGGAGVGGGDGGGISLTEQESSSTADEAATAAPTILHPLFVPVSLPVVMLEERQLLVNVKQNCL